MDTTERAARNLAYFHALDTLPEPQAWQWALTHWRDFVAFLDTDTGRLMVLLAQQEKNPKKSFDWR